MKKRRKNEQRDAFSLFPDLFKYDKQVYAVKNKRNRQHKPVQKFWVRQPLPPDISWLYDATYDNLESDTLADIPSGLVLLNDEETKKSVFIHLKKLGFRIETVETPLEAIHKLSSFDYAVIVMHTDFEKKISIADSTIHRYLCTLPMARRRLMHYILIGPEFATLHNLMALVLSANLVVHDSHAAHLTSILKKSFQDSEELFGPLLQVLEQNEKS